MTQHPTASTDGVFINVRKLAALDIAFHGPRLILAEFGLALLVGTSLAAVLFYLGLFHGPLHSPYQIIAGLVFLCVGLNYLPLLLYALAIAHARSAHAEVAFELEHPDQFRRKYGLQSLLLFLPLVIPVLAIVQELRQRGRAGSRNTPADPT